MRKAAALLLTLLFVAPAVAAELPQSSTADGALSVVDGRGEITLGARTGMVGGVIGRLDKGCVVDHGPVARGSQLPAGVG